MNPPLKGYDLPPDSIILDVNFSYIIYFSESEQYDLVHIQFDAKGDIVYIKNTTTNGLLSTKPISILSPTEALLITKPMIKDKAEIYINLIWMDGNVIDGIGSYYYQILFNRTTEINSLTVTYDELLINATTKEISEVQKYVINDKPINEEPFKLPR